MKRTFFLLAFAALWVCLLVSSCNNNTSSDNKTDQAGDTIAAKSDSVTKSATSDGKVVVSEGDMEQASSDSVDK